MRRRCASTHESSARFAEASHACPRLVKVEGSTTLTMQWFRGGLVIKAHRLLYHSILGSRVIKHKKRALRGPGVQEELSAHLPAHLRLPHYIYIYICIYIYTYIYNITPSYIYI